MVFLIADKRLTDRDIVRLSVTCRDLEATLRDYLAKRLRAANKRRPGIFYWACVNGYSRPVEDLLGVHATKSESLSRGTPKLPICDPNTALVDKEDDANDYDEEFFWERVQSEKPESVPAMDFGTWVRTHDPSLSLEEQVAEFERFGGRNPSWQACGKRFLLVHWAGRDMLVEQGFVDPADSRLGLQNECATDYNTGYDPTCDCRLYFPLHLAAMGGSLTVARHLVDKGARVDAPCWQLVMFNHEFKFDDGLKNDQSLHDAECWGNNPAAHFMYTALHVAIMHGHCRLAEFLLEASKGSRHQCVLSDTVFTPLHSAAGSRKGGLDMIKLALKYHDKQDIDQANFAGLSPLWVASLNNSLDVDALVLLQSVGASLDYDLGNGYTPLIHAVLQDRVEFGQAVKLIQAGADIAVTFRSRPSAQTGSKAKEWDIHARGLRPAEIVCRLVSLPRPRYYSPTPELFASLVSAGLDVNGKNPHSGRFLAAHLFKPLDSAYQTGSVSLRYRPDRSGVLDTLLGLGLNPMATDDHGNTLMEMASSDFDLASCQVLTEHSNEAVEMFKRHWTLDSFIETCLEKATEPVPPDERVDDDWDRINTAEICNQICLTGLKLFVTLGLPVEELANHRLLPELVRLSLSCPDHGLPGEPWHNASEHQKSCLIKFLLDLPYPRELMERRLADGNTVLHHAVGLYREDIVMRLVRAGVDPNQVDNTGCTLAARLLKPTHRYYTRVNLDEEMLVLLRDHGVDMHVAERPPRTHLPYSVRTVHRRWNLLPADIEDNRVVPETNDTWCFDKGCIWCQVSDKLSEHLGPLREFWALVEEKGSACLEIADGEEYTRTHQEPDWGASNGMVAAIRLVERCGPERLFGTRPETDKCKSLLRKMIELFPLVHPDRPGPDQNLVPPHLQALYLREACRTPSVEALRILLEVGRVNPDVPGGDDGSTALVWIIKGLAGDTFKSQYHFREVQGLMMPGVADCIRLLLDQGASLHAKAASHGSHALSAMDCLRSLLGERSSSSPPGLSWGPLQEEMVMLFLHEKLLSIDWEKGSVFVYAGRDHEGEAKLEMVLPLAECGDKSRPEGSVFW